MKEYKKLYKTKQFLRNLLSKAKDKIEFFENSGIYDRNCNKYNGNYNVSGQKTFQTRYTEYLANIRYGEVKNLGSVIMFQILDILHLKVR